MHNPSIHHHLALILSLLTQHPNERRQQRNHLLATKRVLPKLTRDRNLRQRLRCRLTSKLNIDFIRERAWLQTKMDFIRNGHAFHRLHVNKYLHPLSKSLKLYFCL